MEGGIINSAHFNQTVRSGGEEMAALFFTAAAIDLRCSLSNQSQYGELQTIRAHVDSLGVVSRQFCSMQVSDRKP